MRFIFLLIFSLVFYVQSEAQTSSQVGIQKSTSAETELKKESPNTFKDTMHEFASTLDKLNVFSTEDQPLKEEEKAQLSRAIEDFSKKVQALKPSELPNSKGYSISLTALQKHISETERMSKLGQTQYARWMLNATTTVCIACHTQLPSGSSKMFVKPLTTGVKTSEQMFSRAEYLFVTRHFDEANEIYSELIKGFPKNGLNIVKLDTSLRRKVAYYARVKRDPKAGVESLEKDSSNQEIPEAIQKNLTAWTALFRDWSREKKQNLTTASQILKYSKNKLKRTLWDRMIEAADPRVVTYLNLSGLIYQNLFTAKESSETPELLLILGRCENALNENFIYSLGDLYFRECIEKYPKAKVAKECYQALEESYKRAYMTTTGLEMPSPLQQELKDYRKQLGL